MHDIRICKKTEYEKLISFIRNYWKDNHIFSLSKQVLDFQHLNIDNNEYNFIVAVNKKTDNFDAILGFIPMSQYDKNIETKNIWLAIWKVNKKYATTGIGLQLLLELTKLYKTFSIGIIGISDDAMKIYKAFRYSTGNLMHFFIKNENLSFYTIGDFENFKPANIQEYNKNLILSEIDRDDLKNCGIEYKYYPKKSINYFIEKYVKNKFYFYRLFSFSLENKILAIFVSKIITINNSKCMRIIDWIGDFPSDVYIQFQELLVKEKCEYIDLMCYVPNYQKIIEMGFYNLKDNDVIIPNYFEPFIKKNIEINYAYKANVDNYAIFKGDSDQDRPNLLGLENG